MGPALRTVIFVRPRGRSALILRYSQVLRTKYWRVHRHDGPFVSDEIALNFVGACWRYI